MLGSRPGHILVDGACNTLGINDRVVWDEYHFLPAVGSRVILPGITEDLQGSYVVDPSVNEDKSFGCAQRCGSVRVAGRGTRSSRLNELPLER
eukprot:554889-Hanusia_phi.AAC.14